MEDTFLAVVVEWAVREGSRSADQTWEDYFKSAGQNWFAEFIGEDAEEAEIASLVGMIRKYDKARS